jgi:NTE family protein
MKVEAIEVRLQSEKKSETGRLSAKNPQVPIRPTKRRVALALSSGGAKGLAHIGVIQVFEENGIHIDGIAGSSMGAYVAAVWAAGHDGVAMEKFARDVEGKWAWLRLLDPLLVPRTGFLRGDKTRHRLMRSIGDARFSDLPRPLRVVATNLRTLEQKTFCDGEVALAVQASTAIPGICTPVRIGEELYFDGGVVDPLPVDAALATGADIVIAVNVIPTPAYLRCRIEFEREQSEMRKQQFGLGARLFRQAVAALAHDNLLDVMHRTMLGAQMRLAEHSCRRADFVLRPLSFDARWHDFHRPMKYIALGRRVAEEHISEIKALIWRRTHEHRAPHNTLAVAA